jgi:hypothetical protein
MLRHMLMVVNVRMHMTAILVVMRVRSHMLRVMLGRVMALVAHMMLAVTAMLLHRHLLKID